MFLWLWMLSSSANPPVRLQAGMKSSCASVFNVLQGSLMAPLWLWLPNTFTKQPCGTECDQAVQGTLPSSARVLR